MDLCYELISLACDNRAGPQPFPGFGIFPVFSRAGAKVNGRPSFMAIANVHDSKMMLATVDAIEPIRAKTRGRPRRRPHKLHADKGYDYRHLRLALRKRRIIPRIARSDVEPKNRLGRYRWVVERTLSWLNRFRRLKIRYEHRADIHLAFLQLGCALISLRFLG
jgi:transposase